MNNYGLQENRMCTFGLSMRSSPDFNENQQIQMPQLQQDPALRTGRTNQDMMAEIYARNDRSDAERWINMDPGSKQKYDSMLRASERIANNPNPTQQTLLSFFLVQMQMALMRKEAIPVSLLNASSQIAALSSNPAQQGNAADRAIQSIGSGSMFTPMMPAMEARPKFTRIDKRRMMSDLLDELDGASYTELIEKYDEEMFSLAGKADEAESGSREEALLDDQLLRARAKHEILKELPYQMRSKVAALNKMRVSMARSVQSRINLMNTNNSGQKRKESTARVIAYELFQNAEFVLNEDTLEIEYRIDNPKDIDLFHELRTAYNENKSMPEDPYYETFLSGTIRVNETGDQLDMMVVGKGGFILNQNDDGSYVMRPEEVLKA